MLRCLVRSERGNVLLVMTAGIIPVVAAVAGAADVSRTYMAQARLQQSVDAATLAGRKILSDTNIANGSIAEVEVQQFLSADFPTGVFGTSGMTKQLSLAADGNFCVTASVDVPTILMGTATTVKTSSGRVLPITAKSCARRSGSNIDVVLVLDVTGSMASYAGSTTRIQGLKQATLDFLATLDTTRTQLAAEGLRVRVGIVPYNATVNIGRLLNADVPYANGVPYVAAAPTSWCTLATSKNCVWSNIGYPRKATTGPQKWSNNDSVEGNATTTPMPRALVAGTNNVDLTNFVTAGGAAGTTVSDLYAWRGCVEARQTVTTITDTTSTATIPNGAFDILDAAPGVVTGGGTAPAWRPYFGPPSSYNHYRPKNGTVPVAGATGQPWNQLPWRVSNSSTFSYSDGNASLSAGTDTSSGSETGPNYYCPPEAKLLSEATKADLTSYVNSLKPLGSTLHDIGMYWGLAMISPGAPFVNANTYLKAGVPGTAREVKRYIVFMTDGDLDPSESSYSAWGYEDFEQRLGTTGSSDNRTKGRHNTRFLMICEQAKQVGVNISTVSFGLAVTSQLKGCATSADQTYSASTSTDLINIFKQIANNIGYLRVAK